MNNKLTYTLQLDEKTIDNVINFYTNYSLPLNNPYATNHFNYNNVDITVFKSYKVLFNGKKAFDEYSRFSYLVNWEYKDNHAGSDEVGTGDLFGPIVVCGVYFDQKQLELVNSLNIKDSKKLNDQYILSIGQELINSFPNSILILNNEKYNEMINKGFNMNKLKAYLHNQVYLHLLKKVKNIDYFVLDQFCEKNTYFKYLDDFKEVVLNVNFKTKAEDKSPAVAIASLIARYVFLIEMQKISNEVGFEVKKGCNSEVKKQLEFIKKNKGKDYLSKIVKLNFKTLNQ